MFVQTEITPNPNSLKFLPGKVVSNGGSFEITKKDDVKNELIRNLMSIYFIITLVILNLIINLYYEAYFIYTFFLLLIFSIYLILKRYKI